MHFTTLGFRLARVRAWVHCASSSSTWQMCGTALKWKSGAHDKLLRESVPVMCATSAHSQPLFQYMYTELAIEQGMQHDPDFGEAEHQKRVFDRVALGLLCTGKTPVKFSRWFAMEAKMEQVAVAGFHAHLWLFMYTGWLKGWWRRWRDSPLGAPDLPADRADRDDHVLGAHGDGGDDPTRVP
eukprot:6457920-Amphidinium_carterae.1